MTSDSVKKDVISVKVDNSNSLKELDKNHKVYKVSFSKLSLNTIPQEFLNILNYSLLKDNYRQITYLHH